MKIKVLNSDKELGEIDQTIETKFSFANYNLHTDTATRLHEWVKCRDFLGDVIIANYLNTPVNIYGFSATSERIPVDKKIGYLLVKFPTKEVKNTFFSNVEYILPDISIVGRSQNTILIKFDVRYQHAVFLFSYFTFLIKCCCYKYENVCNFVDELVIKYNSSVEASYIRNNKDKFKALMKLDFFSIITSITGWDNENNLTSYSLHNTCGFKSVLMQSNLFHKNNIYSKWVEDKLK